VAGKSLILFLFFCSGATALIYEVVWSKYLTLMFGSTVQAQTVALAVYMGGLALGNRLVGRRADAARRPLALYGYLEIFVGLYAFFFFAIYGGADRLFLMLGSPVVGRPGVLLLIKGVLSVGLLIFPTMLMGGTLPLLAAWLERNTTDAGRASARFYAVNSLGAVAGAWLAGFILIRQLGMVASLQAAAMVNVLVGLVAASLGRKQTTPPAAAVPAQPGAERAGPSPVFSRCVLVAVSGGLSMGLEVMASRALTLIFGASLQAFSIVLMAFILGIGCAGAVVSSGPGRRWRASAASCFALLGAGLFIGLMMCGIEWWVDFYREAKTGLGRSPMGYHFHQLLAGIMSIVVLGLPAGLIGSVLPLCLKEEERAGSLGDRVGRLLTWNTLGAVAGVLLSGFVLMPEFGLRGALGAAAVALCASAAVLMWVNGSRRLILVPTAAAVVVLWFALAGGEGWRLVLSSGVFRERVQMVDRRFMKWRRDHVKLLFYEDAADATVSVEQGDGRTEFGILSDDERTLRINGKADATSRGDWPTQQLMAQLPMMARPRSKEVFLLGFGCGVTAGALLGHPLDRLTIAENCPPVLRAGRYFDLWNRGALTNSRVRILQDDARTALKLGRENYDIIISEPSNPWMVGVGSIFSREFYEIAASRLKDDGIMAQWFHVYEINDGIVAMILRTFSSVFPNMEVWDPRAGDIIILGSKRPWKSDPASYAQVFAREIPRRDLESLGLLTPESVWARQLASQGTAPAIPGPGPIQTDAFPILEYDAPEAFFIGANSTVLFAFDERTWQSDLASREKFGVLHGMDDARLGQIFGQYDSVNLDVQKTLYWRVRLPLRPGDPGLFVDNHPLPSLFRPTNAPPASVNVLPSDNEVIRALAGAEELLDSNSRDPGRGIALIKSALEGQLGGGAPKISASASSFYAALAARVAAHLGRKEEAAKLVATGLALDPGDSQLLYLRRVLIHWGWIMAPL
jgi:spermidine synthase